MHGCVCVCVKCVSAMSCKAFGRAHEYSDFHAQRLQKWPDAWLCLSPWLIKQWYASRASKVACVLQLTYSHRTTAPLCILAVHKVHKNMQIACSLSRRSWQAVLVYISTQLLPSQSFPYQPATPKQPNPKLEQPT